LSSFVEPCARPSPQCRIADPIEGEERAFNTADFAKRLRKRILFGIAGEPAHQRRGRDRSRLDRRRHAQRLIPILGDDTKIDRAADHRGQSGVSGAAVGDIKPAVGKIANARRKSKSEEMAQAEHMIDRAGRVGVMFADIQGAFVVPASPRPHPVRDGRPSGLAYIK
jgi:hypothetical protein